MKLAAVQYRAPKGRPAEARAALQSWADQAGQAGAGLIVCPELATTGYMWASPQELLPHAELPEGPTLAALAPVARHHESWIVCGFPEIDPVAGHLYNSALVIGPDGALKGCYRKILLFDADRPWARAGQRRMIFQAGFGTLFPAICMDLNDDGLLFALARTQPTILAFPTSWVEQGLDVHGYWQARLRGFQGYFVAADNWGPDRGTTFAGRSAIFGPGGVVLASAGAEGDGVVIAEGPA